MEGCACMKEDQKFVFFFHVELVGFFFATPQMVFVKKTPTNYIGNLFTV